jgi:hypothetical protein
MSFGSDFINNVGNTRSYNQITNSRVSNGRVDIKSPDTCSLFALYDKIPSSQCVELRNATEGLWDETTLTKAFFSQKNIQILQNGIRAGVYELSNGQYTIGQQDCDSLKIIMRSIFLQYAANQPDHISEQIKELNLLVLEYAVQAVYSEAQGYKQYLIDASTMYTPIPYPILSKTSDKTLELKQWF